MFGVLPPPQASPQLINRGRGHAGAVTSDGFVYAHFCYGVDNGSYWDANDHVLVGRVSKDQPLNRSAWRFWSGVSDTRAHAHAPAHAPARGAGEGGAAWVADADLAVPVMTYKGMLSQNQVRAVEQSCRHWVALPAHHSPAVCFRIESVDSDLD